jgi:hypothetical protein
VSPRKVTARDYTANISGAEAASKPPVVVGTFNESAAAILHTPRPRPAVAAEPVDVSLINGREPAELETALIVEARMRERAAAVALTGGLT